MYSFKSNVCGVHMINEFYMQLLRLQHFREKELHRCIYTVTSLSNQDMNHAHQCQTKHSIYSVMQVKHNAIDARIKLVNFKISNISILSSAITFNHIFYKLFKVYSCSICLNLYSSQKRILPEFILYVRKEVNKTHKIYQNSKMILNHFINMLTLLKAYRISVELVVHSPLNGY